MPPVTVSLKSGFEGLRSRIAAVTASLMVGTALSFVAALLMGYWLLRARLGRLGLAKVADTLTRLAGAAVAGGIVAFVVSWTVGKVLDPGKILGVVQLVTGGTALLVTYAAVAMALRVEAAEALLRG